MSKYFIGGPSTAVIVDDKKYVEAVIEAICKINGDDSDDYTSTKIGYIELDLEPKPVYPTLIGYLKGEFTELEVLNYVKDRINEQGCKSFQNGSPKYHMEYGLIRCPIGWLIPRSEYKEEYEDQSISTLMSKYIEFAQHVTPGRETFLCELQWLHDGHKKSSNLEFLDDFNKEIQKMLKLYA